jgi:hypothetical protein
LLKTKLLNEFDPKEKKKIITLHKKI